MDSISIGLLGLGTVGSGVVKIIENHQDTLIHQVGCPVKVKKILVQNPSKSRDVGVDAATLTINPEEILNDPTIDVIIEVMGGVEDTKAYLLEALRKGKNVVTANKDLMALYGSELLAAASENGCDLYYEASVGGGIPIIRSLADGLSSDKLTKIMGIVNGTTNFILTKMSQEGSPYDQVLKEAQSLGFAEADPTSDVEGLDAARKMAILASLGFSMNIDLDDVLVKGISSITEEDIKYGKQLGYTMKLIGTAHRDNEKVEVSVQPTLLIDSHPLASVQNEFNAVYVYGEAVGETMFYGPGAGSLPTATAVVSDLVCVLKNMRLGVSGRNLLTPQYTKQLKPKESIYSKYYFRLHVKDEVGVFSNITAIFAQHRASFEKILQLPLKESGLAEIILVTHQTSLKDYEDIIKNLEGLEKIKEIKSIYRVEGGGR
ncbi:homoserine dehydrogenase [Heyndrickxia acidicola]|uniref:Homoserine dehydrogenase n=1 Tax=Heyndrickxia acidicola TaxID=209389 RepID=A0ABU6MDE2_9BACI|nr:homoserine dehydrogenase [Heyndrickxia acidicola]MED1201688.1 homoserine dehydrogenase [Heyndrickxia acidicola]